MAQNIARLGVVLGIDTAEFTKGIEAAKRKLGDIGQFAMKAGAVATAALAAMTYKAMQFADEMADLSDATGVGIGKIVQLSQALQQSGGRADDAGKILIKFAQSVDEAAGGSQKMQDAFAKAGVSLKDLATLSLEQLFDKTANGMANIGNKATQTGTKLDIFGKSIRSVDMIGFNNQMQEGTERFDEYANSIRIAAELNDKLAKKAADFNLIFTKKVIPAINLFFETINTKGGLSETVFEAIGNAIYNITGYIEIARGSLQLLEAQWKSFKSIFSGKFSMEELNREAMNIDNNVKLALEKIRQYREEVLKAKKIEEPKGPAVDQVKESPEVKKLNEMKRVAGLISEEYERQQSFSLAQLAIRNQMIGMTEDERRIQEAINQVLISTSQKIDEITKKREDAIGRADPKDIESLKKVYDDEIAEVQRLTQQYVDAARIIESSSIATQRTFEFGWNKAFNQFAENAFNYAHIAEQVFKSVTDNMLSAIDNFVETGKLNFADFASSVIKDLIKIQLKAQAMQLFSMVGGGLGGVFGSIFGGGQTSATGSFVSPSYGGVATAADGGMINGPTLVGENGPEIFIPQRSGTVIPNQQMGNMADRGNTYVTNNYIDAIDTKSFEDRLYGSSKAVWAANQYGNKNISTSRMRT